MDGRRGSEHGDDAGRAASSFQDGCPRGREGTLKLTDVEDPSEAAERLRSAAENLACEHAAVLIERAVE